MNFISGIPLNPSLAARMQRTPFEGSLDLDSAGNSLCVMDENTTIARVVIDTLDGNCGVCHLHDWGIGALKKKQQLELIKYLELIAEASSYGRIQTGLGMPQQKYIEDILLELGWKEYDRFRSPRTTNICVFLRKDFC